jgi:hypothetical protein
MQQMETLRSDRRRRLMIFGGDITEADALIRLEQVCALFNEN